MADFVFNRGLGRGVEWAERVNANDPTNAVLVIGVLATTGVQADSVLKDLDDWTALVAGATDFVTNTGYARKVLDQTGGITITYDDTNDRVDVDFPDQTWTAVAAGSGWNDVVVGYDSDSTAGTDANILPHTQHDFVLTPDGSDITMQVAAAGYFRAA
jgi:hypothetical protein